MIFLQENILNTDQLNTLFHRYDYNCYASLGINNKPGVGILFLRNLKIKDIHVWEPGRLLHIVLENKISFLNIYAPAGNQSRMERNYMFSETIFRNLSFKNNLPILVGDFNCVLNEKDTELNFNQKKCPPLRDLIDTFNYIDLFRKYYPDVTSYTFSRPHLSRSRLDRIYVPEYLSNLTVDIEHLPSFSDHKFVFASFKLDGAEIEYTRPSYWKLNVTIMEDEDFLSNFENFWTEISQSSSDFYSIAQWWETVAKPKIQKFLISYPKMKAYGIKGYKMFLFECLSRALEKQDWRDVLDIKFKLKSILKQESQGYIVRSKTKEHFESERASLYHANREVRQGEKSCIDELVCTENNVQTSSKDEALIEKNILSFFDQLFNPDQKTNDKYENLFFRNLAKLSDEEKLNLELPISAMELDSALKGCAYSKSPGLDGLPYEFYKKVKHILNPFLLKIFQDQLNNFFLTSSSCRGVTRLLKKVEGVPNPSQLRPITLLPCDYKILSKILTNRLNNVLPTVLTSNQLCTNKPNSIFDGMFNILSSIDYINSNKKSAFLISFDILKAYDRTRVDFISKVLKAMNFSTTFIKWVETFHINITTQFILNAKLTKELKLSVSIRQGDPMAMPLFLINVEPLLRTINDNISGLTFDGQFDEKDEDYVDDVNVISEDLDDIVVIDEIFKRFELLSGTKLNRNEKCKIMGLGGWASKKDWPLNWIQNVQSIKVFGLTLYHTVPKTVRINWETILDKIKRDILIWKKRKIDTLSERSIILQTFIFSKTFYLAHVLPLPNNVATEILKETRNFLWAGKIEKLAIEQMYAPTNEGGLNICNIQAKCDALLMKFIVNVIKQNSSSKKHLNFWLGSDYKSIFNSHGNTVQKSYYFDKISEILKEAMAIEEINVEGPELVKTKILYETFNSSPPPHKIYSKTQLNWDIVWRRLNSDVLCPKSKDILFLIIHDIFPNNKRLFSCNSKETEYCEICPFTEDSNLHYFIHCSYSQPIFNYIVFFIQNFTDLNFNNHEQEILFLNFKPTSNIIENTILFIFSTYILFISNGKKRNLNSPSVAEFNLFLKAKYAKYKSQRLPEVLDLELK